jgi:hypothetical protein
MGTNTSRGKWKPGLENLTHNNVKQRKLINVVRTGPQRSRPSQYNAEEWSWLGWNESALGGRGVVVPTQAAQFKEQNLGSNKNISTKEL